jgi:hypothetical protein
MGNWVHPCLVYGFAVDSNEIICPNRLAKWKCEWYWEYVSSRPDEEMSGTGVIYGFVVDHSSGSNLITTANQLIESRERKEEIVLVEQLRVLLQKKGYLVDQQCSLRIALCGDISHEFYRLSDLTV